MTHSISPYGRVAAEILSRSAASIPHEGPRSLDPLADPALLMVTEALDVAGTGPFLEQARSLADRHPSLLISLEGAPFIDSDGVRALMKIAGELRAADRELRLVVTPGSRVERTLRLLRLDRSLPTFPSVEAARARLSQ